MNLLKCRFLRFILVSLLVVAAVCPAFADPVPLFRLPEAAAEKTAVYGGFGGPLDRLPDMAALRKGKLANGLRYYILENSLPADRAYLTLAVNAGSILEKDNEQGLAHFVEHLAFCGTRRFPGAELINYLRSLGMRFGPEVNAYTTFDKTVYGIETTVEQDQNGIKRIPEKALAILDDWTWAVTFNPEDVDKERPIILEEYRSRLGGRERVWRQVMPVIYRGSLYKDRHPIGLPEIIQNVTVETLVNFYKTWYRPDNMAIILVGDFNGEELEKELTAHFTAPKPVTPLNRPYFELPEPKKGSITTAVITDEELPGSTVYLYFKRSPLPLPRTLQMYRDSLIDYLVETMIDFRTEEKISTGNTPYLAAGAWNGRYGKSSRYYTMAANAKAGRSTETLEALLLEKERLLRFGFTQTELDTAKGALLSNLEMMAAEKDRRESEDFIEELASDFLEEQYAMDVEWEYDAVQQILPGIGLATVNSAIKACFSDDDITVIITSPAAESEGLPGEAAIIKMINESRGAVIEKPEEKTSIPDLINEAVEPGSVKNITQGGAGTEIWELSNGMTLILASTANKNNELTYYALARGGIISAGAVNDESLLGGLGFSQEEAYFSAKLAAEIQSASGLGPLSRPELMNFLSDKQISISFWAGNNTRGVRGSSSVKDMSALFQLLYCIFTRPRVDQNGLSLVLDNYRTKLQSESDVPEAFFFRELTRLIYSDHPLLAPLELGDLDHVNGKAALAFLTLAMNPADYTLVFAGSLGDRDEFKKLVEMYLASIPNGGLPRWNAWLDPEVKRPEKTEKIVYKGKEEKCIVSMCWYVPKIWTEEDNGAVLVLNEYLEIVLTDEIREKLGGVYSISSYVSLSPAPAGELSLEIYFICDPARAAELRKAVKDQLAALCLAADGETVKRAKEALVKNFEQSMENNGFVARNMANFLVITDTPLFHLPERPSLYRAVTEENVRLLTAELLKGGPIELVLMPESADK